MSLNTIVALTEDQPLLRRIVAQAAKERLPDPESWVRANLWRLATLDGWAEAYQQAQAHGDLAPGRRSDVITDDAISAGVAMLRTELEAEESQGGAA